MGLFSSRNRGYKTSVDSDRGTTPASGTGEPGDDPQRTQTLSTRPMSTGTEVSAERQAEATTPTGETAGRITGSEGDKRMATIGQSIIIKGELTGEEDLEIEGQVDGNVNLANHQLTVGANGRLKAQVTAKSIIVIGQVIGDLTATERIEIQATGVVEGDLRAPRLNVQEGAVLIGSIDMTATSAGANAEPKKPATPPQSAPNAGNAGASNAEARKTA